MPNPLDALKKAETIGAGPGERFRQLLHDTPVTQDSAPLPLSTAAMNGLGGLGRSVGGWVKGLMGGGEEAAPGVVQGVLRGLPEGAEDMITRLSAGARPVVQGLQRAGAFAGDRTVGGIHSLGTAAATSPAATTLGEVSPEFTPATETGQAMYNAGRQGMKQVTDPMEAAYARIKATMGRP